MKIVLADLAPADPATALLVLAIMDPAMGSGHFLVSLVGWLSDRVLTALGDAPAAVASANWGSKENVDISPLTSCIAAVRDAVIGHARKHGWPIVED